MSAYKRLVAKRFASPTTPKKRLSGHDPARKKTGATATTLGSTYDFRKNLSTKSATKKKSASVTVGTAGSSKSTKVDLKKKTTSKPKTVDGKTIKSAPPGGWGSKTTSTTTKPKAPSTSEKYPTSKGTVSGDLTNKPKLSDFGTPIKKSTTPFSSKTKIAARKRKGGTSSTMTVKTSAGDSGSGPTKQAAMNDMRRKSGGAGGRRRVRRRSGSKGTGIGGRMAAMYARAKARRKAKGPNANASDTAKRKTSLAHAKAPAKTKAASSVETRTPAQKAAWQKKADRHAADHAPHEHKSQSTGGRKGGATGRRSLY